MGSPLQTALRLLASGNWSHLTARLKDRWRRRQLRRGRPFIYQRLGSRYVVIPGNTASEASYLDEPEEKREIAIWRAWIQPADVVIDGGAHTGLYTLPAAEKTGPGGFVLAVDADEGLIGTIRQSAALLGCSPSCRLLTAALGDKDGVAEFFFAATPNAPAVMQSLQNPGGDFAARQVPMQTLATVA
jgi:FkbM family methyltransferase